MSASFRQQLLYPFLVALAGFGIASVIDVSNLPQQTYYDTFTYALLAVGLYGSVYGIHLGELKSHTKIIMQAVTIGVLLKTVIIGFTLYLVSHSAVAFLLGLTVAQIDPLSVATLLQAGPSKLSTRAKTILGAWSSFDDPMTVLLSIYALYFFLPQSGTGSLINSIAPFFIGLAQNLLFVLAAYLIYKYLKHNSIAMTILLAVCFIVAVMFKWMLGIAIIGLFLRPEIKKLSLIISAAFYTAVLLLGFLLVNGVFWAEGLALAVGAIFAQIIVGFLLTRDLPRNERLYLAFAQQNGITAMILALFFEKDLAGTVGVVAPAIVFINMGYYLFNRVLFKS
ncbi:MAG: cation:proton antiporter [Anaerolineales bacterium]|nr:cation:proton antiporter [Anaerolineales bacterium]